jgi:transcriptional regulator with XRE-family HTH domain
MWDKSHMARQPQISPDAVPVAAEVYRRMMDLEIGQKALAQAAGLNDTYVRDLIAGKSRNPKTEQLQKLADYFGCRLEDLTNPGSASRDQSSNEVIDFPGVLPLRPSEVRLVAMWRYLGRPARDRVIRFVAEMIAEQAARREANDR